MNKVTKRLSKYGQWVPSILPSQWVQIGLYNRLVLAKSKNTRAIKPSTQRPNLITQFNGSAMARPLAMVRPLAMALTLNLTLTACDKTPPDYRAEVTLPEYSTGDARRGKLLYKEACSQCHQLTPGLNKKGPQLLNVYGAPAADLEDYNYSQSLRDSGWIWNAETLDPYIADPTKVLPESKMLSDPMPDASERTDIIAYLSTLRAPVPTDPNAPISPPTE